MELIQTIVAVTGALVGGLAVAKSYLEVKKVRGEIEKLKLDRGGVQSEPPQLPPRSAGEEEHQHFLERYLEFVARETALIALPRVTFGYPRIALAEVFVGLDAAVTTTTEGQASEATAGQPRVPDDRVSLVRAIIQAKHVVLLGEQGSGKSTLLTYIVNACTLPKTERSYALGTDTKLIPIIIDCHQVAESLSVPGFSLHTAVAALGSPNDLEWPDGMLTALLEAERILVMFDGLDEIVDDVRRASVAGWIDGLISAYGRNHFVVASRPFAHHATPIRRATTEIILTELDDHRVTQLVQRLWTALPLTATSLGVNELLLSIEADAGLRRVAANPLLLSILTLVAHRTGNVPRPGLLYSQLVETLLHRDTERGIAWPGVTDEEHARTILARLAFAIQQAGRPALPLSKLETRHTEDLFWPTPLPVEVLTVLAVRTGLIQVSEADVGFSHSLIRAYFVAYFLDRFRTDATQFLTTLWRDRWWRDVLLAFAARGRGRELVKELEQMTDDLFQRRFFLQADCAIETKPDADSGEWADLTNHLSRIAFTGRFASQRREAQYRLARLASPSVVSELVDQAVSGHPEKERIAIDALSQVDPALAYRAVLNLSQFATRPRTRAQLLTAIGRRAERDGRTFLLECIRDPNSPDVRAAAAAALGRPTNDYAITALLHALERDSDSDVRRKAAESLSQIVKFRPDAKLAEILLVEDDWLVRARLLSLLQRDGRTLEAKLVSELSGTGDSSRRWKAAEGLGYIRTATAERILARSLRTDNDGDVRRACASALAGTRDPAAIGALMRSIEVDEFSDVRAAAASALSSPDRREATFLMKRCLEEGSATAASAIVRALGRILSSHATELLKELLSNTELAEEVRETAAEALAHGARPGITPVLTTRLATDPSWRVRSRCAAALSGKRAPEIVSALCRAIASDEWVTVRAWAIESVRMIESSEVSRVIMNAAMSDRENYVRWRAIESLRFLGEHEALSMLIRIAQSSSEPIELRLIAIQTAGFYSDPAVVRDMMYCLDDTAVSDAVYDTLFRVTESASIPMPETV